MARVIQLSEAASLAIHAMILIGRSEQIINVNKIAEITGSSRNHLAKVMQRLVKDNYVKSTRGPSGGFILNRKPAEITLLDIYQSLEGAITNTGCPINHTVCPFDKCLMGGIISKLSDEFKNYLENQTLESYL
ncbi:MAG: Rrf2 family transcriptional regulator [Bacteroidetes bacterium]|nr:Rrf2 family transcriptional regulator [Bacteroidota bacterium]